MSPMFQLFKHSVQQLPKIAAVFTLTLGTLPGNAQALTAFEIVEKALNHRENISFEGQKELSVSRLNSGPQTATALIRYINRQNYAIEITGPGSILGIRFHMDKGINSAFFPDERLFLFAGGKDTSDMPESIILGQVTDQPTLLRENYHAVPVSEDFVSANPTWVLDFTPKNGFMTPRRKYWIDKDTYQVLREERYWGTDQPPYATASYITFKKHNKPITIPPLTPPEDVNRINLSGKEKNAFLTYSTVAEAEQKEKLKIAYPTYLPPGFKLKYIQVFTLFGARIQVMNFTDGMNDLLVTIRPQQNAFVTLLAGAFSLNLIKKISDLSYQAPNNYFSRNASKSVGVAFGDLIPTELEKVAASLAL
jgi:hypothetical protein